MNKIIVCRGLPASGKSTFARQWVLEDPEHRIRINQDDIRNMLGKYWVPNRETLVQHIQIEAIHEAMNLGFDIISDNTNMNPKILSTYSTIAKDSNYIIEYKDFFDTPLSVCVERDKNRESSVSEEVIKGFFEKYKNMYHLNSK